MKEKRTTLSEELNIALKEMEQKGIKYPDAIYVRVKMVMTTLDSIENQFIKPKEA